MPSLLKSFFKRAETWDAEFTKERSSSIGSKTQSIDDDCDSVGSASSKKSSALSSKGSVSSAGKKAVLVTSSPVQREKCIAKVKPGAKRHAPPVQEVAFHTHEVRNSPKPKPVEENVSSKSAAVDVNVVYEEESQKWFNSPQALAAMSFSQEPDVSSKSATVDMNKIFHVQDDSWYTAPRPNLQLSIPPKPVVNNFMAQPQHA